MADLKQEGEQGAAQGPSVSTGSVQRRDVSRRRHTLLQTPRARERTGVETPR